MSFLALIFGTKLPAWLQELIGAVVVAIIVTLIAMHIHHKIYEEGIAAQQAQDQKDIDRLAIENAQISAEAAAKAAMADQAHQKELDDEDAYRRQHPATGPVRLCKSGPTPSGGGLSQGAGADSSNASASTSSAGVHTLPAGDSSAGTGTAGPDISRLLELLAVRGDQVSAQLREFQSR